MFMVPFKEYRMGHLLFLTLNWFPETFLKLKVSIEVLPVGLAMK
jgi:hypothetical protein